MPQTEVVNIVSIGETWNPEQYIKHWTIYQILNNLSNIEQFIKHWTIYQTLNNLSNPEQYIKHWTIKHWTIYQTLNNISNIEQFIKNWTIYQTLNNLSNIKQFIKHWTIYQTQLKLSPLPVKNKFKKIEVRIKKDFFCLCYTHGTNWYPKKMSLHRSSRLPSYSWHLHISEALYRLTNLSYI